MEEMTLSLDQRPSANAVCARFAKETRVTDALAQLFFNLATRCGFSRVTSADRYDTGFEERIQTGQQAAECGVGCCCYLCCCQAVVVGKGKESASPSPRQPVFIVYLFDHLQQRQRFIGEKITLLNAQWIYVNSPNIFTLSCSSFIRPHLPPKRNERMMYLCSSA